MSQLLSYEDTGSLLSVLSHASELSKQELVRSLEAIPGVEVAGNLPAKNELAGYHRYSIPVTSSRNRKYSGLQVWGLDPATATVLVIGLGILLDYVRTSRNPDTSSPGGGGPPTIDSDGSGPQELCKHKVDGEECGRPLRSPTTVRQGGSIVVIRHCTKDPGPHPTVEYFIQDS